MAKTAPELYTWIKDKSCASNAPITRDLFKKMTRNLHHLYMRVTGSAGDLTAEGVLSGHMHTGGNDGMPMPRHIDSRAHLINTSQTCNTQAIWTQNLTDALHGAAAPDLDWRGVADFKLSGDSWYSVPVFRYILVSPGTTYIGARVRYRAIFSTTWDNKLWKQKVYQNLQIAYMRMRVKRSSVSEWSNPYFYHILRPTLLFDGADEYKEAGPDVQSKREVFFGPIQTPNMAGIVYDDFSYLIDISAYTGGSDAREFDIDFQVRHIFPFRNCLLSFWNYDLYELANPPQG